MSLNAAIDLGWEPQDEWFVKPAANFDSDVAFLPDVLPNLNQRVTDEAIRQGDGAYKVCDLKDAADFSEIAPSLMRAFHYPEPYPPEAGYIEDQQFFIHVRCLPIIKTLDDVFANAARHGLAERGKNISLRFLQDISFGQERFEPKDIVGSFNNFTYVQEHQEDSNFFDIMTEYSYNPRAYYLCSNAFGTAFRQIDGSYTGAQSNEVWLMSGLTRHARPKISEEEAQAAQIECRHLMRIEFGF